MGDDLVNWWLTILFKKKRGSDLTRVTSVGRQTCQLGHHWLAWPSVWIISTSTCQKNGDILYTSSYPPDLLTAWLNRFDSEIEIPIYSRLDFEILLRQINVQMNGVSFDLVQRSQPVICSSSIYISFLLIPGWRAGCPATRNLIMHLFDEIIIYLYWIIFLVRSFSS